MNKKITVTGANKVFFVFTALFMIFQVVLIVMTIIFGENFIDENVYKVLIINQYVLILIPILIFVIFNKFNLKEVFRLNKLEMIPAFLIVFITILGNVTAMMLNNIMVYFMQFIGNVPSQPIPVPKNITELLVGIGIIAVSPAICEELLHRGIIMRAYEQRGSIKAIFISAIFFGIFHFDITNLFGATFMGIIIGYVVIRTNSLFAGILVHFLNNLIAELLLFFGRNQESQQKNINVTLEELGYLILVGVCCLVALFFVLKLFKNLTQTTAIIRAPIANVRQDIISVITHWPIIVIIVLYLLLGTLTLYSLAMNPL